MFVSNGNIMFVFRKQEIGSDITLHLDFNNILKPQVAKMSKSVQTGQQAINNGNSIKFSKSPKKIRVFDFDDTLARTKSNVLYTMPDGTTGSLTAGCCC